MPEVAAAVLEVDRLVSRLFKKHFGDAADAAVQADYIDAMLCFGCDTLPPATERAGQFCDNDPRRKAAARHAMEHDLVWFSCALHLEAVHAIYGVDEEHARRTLMLAGIAVGCSADFVWRGHRQSRPEYSRRIMAQTSSASNGHRAKLCVMARPVQKFSARSCTW